MMHTRTACSRAMIVVGGWWSTILIIHWSTQTSDWSLGPSPAERPPSFMQEPGIVLYCTYMGSEPVPHL
ncbi:uncharacterized protein BO95DRAFT_446366 [Aspergillus brunneoviolaceus CBS 621.78]|uniref:Uncharacterized protein n=1 Tax=Aspergillus brunneoviolaceus CBS 621.78 TaxID=1450534 RepID=A0ACD1FYM2_9EURO|nr:hypothetical protein BO95DRAFT_446366 [Aspergillus brunneoviolaceus CBS 621.78]RAH42080.1 hypothetical protein BO95DRAFT_446366 [Aspergillus brunneoviolaceus CBS 621.78]